MKCCLTRDTYIKLSFYVRIFVLKMWSPQQPQNLTPNISNKNTVICDFAHKLRCLLFLVDLYQYDGPACGARRLPCAEALRHPSTAAQ